MILLGLKSNWALTNSVSYWKWWNTLWTDNAATVHQPFCLPLQHIDTHTHFWMVCGCCYVWGPLSTLESTQSLTVRKDIKEWSTCSPFSKNALPFTSNLVAPVWECWGWGFSGQASLGRRSFINLFQDLICSFGDPLTGWMTWHIQGVISETPKLPTHGDVNELVILLAFTVHVALRDFLAHVAYVLECIQ